MAGWLRNNLFYTLFALEVLSTRYSLWVRSGIYKINYYTHNKFFFLNEGVGRGVHRHFLKQVAIDSGGHSCVIRTFEDENMEQTLVYYFWKATSPFIKDIEFRTSIDHMMHDRISKNINQKYYLKEEEVEVFFFMNASEFLEFSYKHELWFSMSYFNSHTEKEESHRVTASLSGLTSGHMLHKLAYQLKINNMIRSLKSDNLDPDQKKLLDSKIIELSTRFQILSERSSFIVALPGVKKGNERQAFRILNIISEDYMEAFDAETQTCQEHDIGCRDDLEILAKIKVSRKKAQEPEPSFVKSKAISRCLFDSIFFLLVFICSNFSY